MKIFPFVFIVLSMLGCHSKPPMHKHGDLVSGMAKIEPTMPNSKVNGVVTFVETKDGLQVHADLNGVPPGKHGFHVHEFGELGHEGNDAGGHYNPNHTKHGFVVTEGLKKAHAGDFGNIEADESGHAVLDLFVPGVFLTGMKNSIAGRAIIVHEREDDFSQPTGNAGARIGGGIIVVTKPIVKQ
jgi:superoxide dismutase, Cu-Zn family